MDIVEDIKNRINIEELVGQYVQLKKAGRNFKGLCPFHQEKTPSFMVSPEKQIAYCFGCHKGGDVFKFIEEVEGISFQEAIQVLATKAGIDVSKYALKSSGPKKEEREVMIETLSSTNEYYIENFNSDLGKDAKEYILKRGVKEETLGVFEVGFAPDSFDATRKYLAKKGFNDNAASKVGLLSAGNESGKFYDKFRGRLIFPIRDHLGRVVGFGGRALQKDAQPKYLNSPETPVYHKSNVLYGLYQAKAAIKEKDSVIIVEGYMDVVMCNQAGFGNVVASSGTALTSQQLKLISRYTKDIHFAFDMDDAGLEATKRAYLLALDFDVSTNVVTIGEKDPADCIKDDPKAFKTALENAKPFMEFYFDKVFEKYNKEDVGQKQKIFDEILPFLKRIKNKVQQDFYVRMFASRVSMKESQIYDEIDRLTLPDSHPGKAPEEEKRMKVVIHDLLLGFLLEYPHLYEEYAERIDEN